MTNRRDIGSRLENWARLYHEARHPGAEQDRRRLDLADARQVDDAMPALPTLQRSLLWWCYVRQETPEAVCRRLGMSHRPATQFVDTFRVAQSTIQALAEASLPQDR